MHFDDEGTLSLAQDDSELNRNIMLEDNRNRSSNSSTDSSK